MAKSLQAQGEIVSCTRCPRLVEYRERVAREKIRRFKDWEYWGRPVPSLGGVDSRLLLIGLAPAAHGGNRTGRIFTGDRSGDWLYRALYNFGFANQPTSTHRSDGLRLIDCYITAAIHCSPPDNKPLPSELANCRPYLLEELQRLKKVKVVVPLGLIGFKTYFLSRRQLGWPNPSPLPPFGHGLAAKLSGGVTVISSYHPSQQNTQTGKLTEKMFDDVFRKARNILDGAGSQKPEWELPRLNFELLDLFWLLASLVELVFFPTDVADSARPPTLGPVPHIRNGVLESAA